MSSSNTEHGLWKECALKRKYTKERRFFFSLHNPNFFSPYILCYVFIMSYVDIICRMLIKNSLISTSFLFIQMNQTILKSFGIIIEWMIVLSNFRMEAYLLFTFITDLLLWENHSDIIQKISCIGILVSFKNKLLFYGIFFLRCG